MPDLFVPLEYLVTVVLQLLTLDGLLGGAHFTLQHLVVEDLLNLFAHLHQLTGVLHLHFEYLLPVYELQEVHAVVVEDGLVAAFVQEELFKLYPVDNVKKADIGGVDKVDGLITDHD